MTQWPMGVNEILDKRKSIDLIFVCDIDYKLLEHHDVRRPENLTENHQRSKRPFRPVTISSLQGMATPDSQNMDQDISGSQPPLPGKGAAKHSF
jgi:hypothetical protein